MRGSDGETKIHYQFVTESSLILLYKNLFALYQIVKSVKSCDILLGGPASCSEGEASCLAVAANWGWNDHGAALFLVLISVVAIGR